MRSRVLGIAAIFGAALAVMPGQASSHREAPLTAQDPMADNTDVYAWVASDEPDKVTLIANFIPFQNPNGGPNFYSFDPNVVYEIHIDNNGDAVEDITYQWRFTAETSNPATFLHNTGAVTTLDDPDLGIFDLLGVDSGLAEDSTAGFNVSSLAIQVPKSALARGGQTPSSATDPNAIIGVWSTASRFVTRTLTAGAQGRLQRVRTDERRGRAGSGHGP